MERSLETQGNNDVQNTCLDRKVLIYKGDDRGWVLTLPGRVDVAIEGDESEPDQICLALASDMAADLCSQATIAARYLNAFMAQKGPNPIAKWYLLGMEAFRERGQAVVDLQFTLDQDTYGVWGVRFFRNKNGLQKSLFYRRQI